MTSPAIAEASEQSIKSTPIKVLVLRSVDGAGGGAESIILRTAERIDRSRVDYVVACIRRSGDDHYDFGKKLAPTGVEYHEIVQRGTIDRNVWTQIKELHRIIRPDVVHAHDYKASYYARRLARRFGVKPLATLHGWTGHKLRERYFYYPLDRMIVRGFPAIIGVSNQIRDTIIRAGAKPQSVVAVPNGIDANAYGKCETKRREIRKSLGLTDGVFVIGGVGRLERQKRFDYFIQTAELLLARHPHFRFLIAGTGSLYSELDHQIKRLGIERNCRLLGHRDDIRDLYSAFDLLFQSSDYEGTPTVVVEAMACELPIVATDAGGTRDLIDDGVHGFIVPIGQPQRMATAIEAVLSDRDGVAECVAAAKQRVHNELSFDNRTEKLISIYQSLVRAD